MSKKFRIVAGLPYPYKLEEYGPHQENPWGNEPSKIGWFNRGTFDSIEAAKKLAEWLAHGDQVVEEFEL